MHVLHHQSPTALCEGLVEELAGGSPSNTLTLRRHSADLIFGSSMRVLAAMKVARVPIPFNSKLRAGSVDPAAPPQLNSMSNKWPPLEHPVNSSALPGHYTPPQKKHKP